MTLNNAAFQMVNLPHPRLPLAARSQRARRASGRQHTNSSQAARTEEWPRPTRLQTLTPSRRSSNDFYQRRLTSVSTALLDYPLLCLAMICGRGFMRDTRNISTDRAWSKCSNCCLTFRSVPQIKRTTSVKQVFNSPFSCK